MFLTKWAPKPVISREPIIPLIIQVSKEPLPISFSSIKTRGKKYSNSICNDRRCPFCITTRWGPLTTISGFVPGYTHLQPWLNGVCWGYNYLITRGDPSCRRHWTFSTPPFCRSFCFAPTTMVAPTALPTARPLGEHR